MLDTNTGDLLGKCYKRHRHQEYINFLNVINRNVPNDKQIHIISDNYSTHKHEKVKKWFAKHKRFHMHFTPTSASWMNQVEIWSGILHNKRIKRGVFRSVKDLIQKIEDFIRQYNENSKPFDGLNHHKKYLKKPKGQLMHYESMNLWYETLD